MRLAGMKSAFSDYLGYSVFIVVGILVALMPLSLWVADSGALVLVALGTAIVSVGVMSLRDFTRKQKEKA